MIITITGKPCSGKSTIAHILEDEYGFTRYSVGDIFKEEAKKRNMSSEEFNDFCMKNAEYDYFIDNKTKELGKTLSDKKVVFDSRLAWHFIPHSFKVYVDLSIDEMTRRLVNSNRTGKEQYEDAVLAKNSLLNRRQLEIDRYKMIYNVNIEDLKNYDFVISSENLTANEVASKIYNEYLKFVKNNRLHT